MFSQIITKVIYDYTSFGEDEDHEYCELEGPNQEARHADLHRLIEEQTQLTNEPAKSLGKVIARMPHCISWVFTLSDIIHAVDESKWYFRRGSFSLDVSKPCLQCSYACTQPTHENYRPSEIFTALTDSSIRYFTLGSQHDPVLPGPKGLGLGDLVHGFSHPVNSYYEKDPFQSAAQLESLIAVTNAGTWQGYFSNTSALIKFQAAVNILHESTLMKFDLRHTALESYSIVVLRETATIQKVHLGHHLAVSTHRWIRGKTALEASNLLTFLPLDTFERQIRIVSAH